MALKFWLNELFKPVTPFEFSTTIPFEVCVENIRSLRKHLNLAWWNRTSYTNETLVVMTPVDNNTFHFAIERIVRRFMIIQGTGFIKRGDGIFTEVTGELSINTLYFIPWV